MAEKIAYISGALTNVKDLEKARAFYERIGAVCQQEGFNPYIPHQHTDPIRAAEIPPREVWQTDYDIVSRNAVVVAEVDEPSDGVGAELEIARENRVPIILLAKPETRVSRMTRGNPAVREEIRFKTESDGLEKLAVALKQLVDE